MQYTNEQLVLFLSIFVVCFLCFSSIITIAFNIMDKSFDKSLANKKTTENMLDKIAKYYISKSTDDKIPDLIYKEEVCAMNKVNMYFGDNETAKKDTSKIVEEFKSNCEKIIGKNSK